MAGSRGLRNQRLIRPLSHSPSSWHVFFFTFACSVSSLLLLFWDYHGQLLSFLSPSLKMWKDEMLRNDAAPVSVELDMNSNCKIYQDVHRLLHYPEESKIAIYFNKERNCAQPQLIGRLSGRALTTITWETSYYNIPDDDEEEEEAEETEVSNLVPATETHHDNNINETKDVLLGHYRVPQSGTYFLEIIAIMCEDLQYDAEFTGTCLVDPNQHRLTQDGVFINAMMTPPPPSTQHDTSNIIGYWWHHDGGVELNETLIPLYTRYQPQGCRSDSTLYHCSLASDLTRFDNYQFKFSTAQYDDDQLSTILEGKIDKICIEGASHARMLRGHMAAVLANLNSRGVHVAELDFANETRFASDFDEAKINFIIAKNCSKVIVTTGQWDAGWPNDRPTLFPEYEQILNKTIPLMLKMFTAANIQVYHVSTQCVPILVFVEHDLPFIYLLC